MRRLIAMLLILGVAPASAQDASTPLSLSLRDALLRAGAASPAVAIARAGINGAEASWLRARSARLPQLSGSATYTRTIKSEFSAFSTSTSSDTFPAPTNCHRFVPNPSLPIADRLDSLEHGLDCTANGSFDFSQLPFGRPNTWNFGLSGSQSLFDATIGGQVAAANAGRDEAAIEFDAQRAGAVLTVAQAYVDAQLAQRLADIADSTLSQAERTYQQTHLQRQVGNAAEFDELRASVARNNQEPVAIQRHAQRDQAMLRLRQVLDLPTGTAIALTTPLIDTTEVAMPPDVAAMLSHGDASIDARAPVREAAAGVRASEGQLRAARGERIPAVGLSSTYAKIDFPQDPFSFDRFLTDWSVNLQLTLPILTGGRLHADRLAAEAARDQAAMRLKQARQQAQLEHDDAGTQLESARAAWSASLGTTAQARRAYDIADLRYRNGLSTLTDLGDARLQLDQAQANSAQAARDLQVARLRAILLVDLPFGAGQTSGSP